METGSCVSAVCELAVMIHEVLYGFQREEFPTRLEELRPQLQGLVNMCDELIQNSSLRLFLTLILQIGNCLNAVSPHLKVLMMVLLSTHENRFDLGSGGAGEVRPLGVYSKELVNMQ